MLGDNLADNQESRVLSDQVTYGCRPAKEKLFDLADYAFGNAQIYLILGEQLTWGFKRMIIRELVIMEMLDSTQREVWRKNDWL